MILGVVGNDRTFDRLVCTLDSWAGARPGRRVTAQIGETGFRPRHLSAVAGFSADWFSSLLPGASLVVTHASLGVVRKALQAGVPVLLMPRDPLFGEDSGEHQLVLAGLLGRYSGVTVATDEEQLTRLLNAPSVRPPPQAGQEFGTDLRHALAGLAVAEAGR